MPKFSFDWTLSALQKLDDNDVEVREFERVVLRAAEVEWSRSSGRPCCRGRVGNRVLFCVFDYLDDWRVQPVTAFWIHDD